MVRVSFLKADTELAMGTPLTYVRRMPRFSHAAKESKTMKPSLKPVLALKARRIVSDVPIMVKFPVKISRKAKLTKRTFLSFTSIFYVFA